MNEDISSLSFPLHRLLSPSQQQQEKTALITKRANLSKNVPKRRVYRKLNNPHIGTHIVTRHIVGQQQRLTI